MVSRGRVVTDPAATRCGCSAPSSTSPTPARQAERRLAAVQRAAAIAEVAAELANAARIEELAEIALRGAQVLGAESSALAVFDPGGGPLRLHMTRRLVERGAGARRLPASAGVEIELDDGLPTQYAARHGRRVLLADREEALARFPRPARASTSSASARWPRCRCGSRAGCSAASSRSGPSAHPFAADDLEVLEALTAQIALSVSRLQADAERVAAVAAMAEANRQLQLLADAGRVLSGTLEIHEQIEQLAELVVPGARRLVLARGHRRAGPAARPRLRAPRPGPPGGGRGLRAGHGVGDDRLGRPRAWSPAPAGRWSWTPSPGGPGRAGAARRRRCGRRWPGWARGRPPSCRWPRAGRPSARSGCSTARSAARSPPTQVETAVEIGRRAGLALHHARLFGQQRALADALQRSMLTDPPEPDHCEIVVRYVPAAAGAEIGGDWYDAFLQTDGATVLAIGDVVGHDTRAAAAMGQVRGLLRGIGFSSGGRTAEVLAGLDRAMQGLALDTMATALVARLERDDAEDRRATVVRLRWSSAGHPAPAMLDRRRHGHRARRARRPTCCSASPRTAPRGPRRRPAAGAPPCCSTPTGWSSGATATSTRAPPSWSRCSRSAAAAAGRAVRPGARAAVPARRRGRRRAPRRPPRRTARPAAEPRCPRLEPTLPPSGDAAGRGTGRGWRTCCGCAAAGRRPPAPPSRATPTAPAARRPAR